MNLVRLYIRVLRLLGKERRLGWLLAVANLALAVAQFAEPVLFGKVVDMLAGAKARGQAPRWEDLLPLLGAWAGFGASPSGAAPWWRSMPTACRTGAGSPS